MNDERNDGMGGFFYLLIGAAIGVVAGMMLAPKSGREMRSDVAGFSRRTYRKGAEEAQHLKERVSESVGSFRESMDRPKSRIQSAIEAGKQAYREERGTSEPGSASGPTS